MSIKVLYLVGKITPTSIPIDIAKEINKIGEIQVDVAAFYESGSSSNELVIEPLNAANRFSWTSFKELYSLLIKEEYDILHTHDNFIGSIGRIIGSLAGVDLVNTEHRSHESFTTLQNVVNAPTFPLADIIVANSEATLGSFKKWEQAFLKRSNTTVVYNGVDVDTITKKRADRDETPFRVITVGRMIPVKNQRVLIQAFSKARSNIGSAELVLVGDGPLRDALELEVNRLGIQDSVRFTGLLDRDQVYNELSNSDLFVIPSLSEGFCVAAVEAMASGLPVLASDIDVLHEVIGEGGLFVNPEDVDHISKRIERFFNDSILYREISDKAYSRAKSEFSLKDTAKEYSKIYKTLVGK